MSDEYTIIPFSGIQVMDFELDLDSISVARRRFAERLSEPQDDQSFKQLIPVMEERISESALEAKYGESIFSEKYENVINEFEEKWLPAPVFKSAGAEAGQMTFEEGPSTWARMRIKVRERGANNQPTKIICQIALDTSVDLENNSDLSGEDYYLMPSRANVLAEARFRFVSSFTEMSWFLQSEIKESGEWKDTQKWVTDWITVNLENKIPINKITTNRVWAKYLTLVDLFSFLDLPDFRMINTFNDADLHPPVPTDFVIDLGNSRTCGILLEKHSNGEIDIEKAIPFKIRDFENAESYDSGLIESRIELAQADFGRDDISKRSGRSEAFLWPSPARLGREARRIQRNTSGTSLPSGLSSSKRYLWDLEPTQRDWRFSNSPDNGLPSIGIICKQLLTQSGDYRRNGDQRAHNLRFSRSSFVMFMIAELISHAFVQINNPQERSTRLNQDLPRYLNKIILTIPTSTPSFEQNILKKRAKDALDFVWNLLKIPEGRANFEKPELIIDWDEASCSQQVFLYNGLTKEYFSKFGRNRFIKGMSQKTMRIASVDIGGGTTDLMVTSYLCETGKVIVPVQEFREGFRVAGDDILYELVKELIIPAIECHLFQSGGKYADSAIANFFRGNPDAEQTQLRSTFANSVLIPLAIKLMKQFEDTKRVSALIDFNVDLEGNQKLQSRIFQKISHDSGLENWPGNNFSLTVDVTKFNQCVENVLARVVDNIALALGQFKSDVILLTGRPSKLPIIRELFEKKFLVSPHKLISLHSYKVGSWYPFRDTKTGRIGDPKSTVAIGALLNSVSVHELGNYSFSSDNLQLKSTANFIGPMELTERIPSASVLINNTVQQLQEEFDMEFFSVVYLGSKQIDRDDWASSPLYKVQLIANQTPAMPLTITFHRRSDAFDSDEYLKGDDKEYLKEKLKIGEIVDAHGDPVSTGSVKLSFNTLGRAENYWMESGLIK